MLKTKAKVNRCNFHDGIIRWQILKTTTVCAFVLALTISQILIFKIVDLQKVGRGHGVQFSQ